MFQKLQSWIMAHVLLKIDSRMATGTIWFCIYCGREFLTPIVDEWIACIQCDEWCHEACIDGQSLAINETAYKRWSCHSGHKLLCKLCRTFPPPAMGARFTVFWACRPCVPAGCLVLLLTKAGDVETNPGPTYIYCH